MDINKSLRMAIDTGDVKLGCNQTSKAIEKGEVKLVILSSNCPSDTVSFAEGSKANVHKFNGNNATLGAACAGGSDAEFQPADVLGLGAGANLPL